VPASGGDEREWLTHYVNARHHWLANHSNPLLQNTVYRTNCFKEQIAHGNWDLSHIIRANGVTIN
jgi:chitosanase